MCKKEILTVKEVSDYLQCSSKTVLNLLNTKKLNGFKINNYSWRIKYTDLLSYILKVNESDE